MFKNGYSELPIYVHVPFCSKKCDYCDFFSIPRSDPQQQRRVVEQTLRQLSTLLAALKPRAIPTVYIGGGTPNSLFPELFQRLINGISHILEAYRLVPGYEWTVELNPELITPEQMDFLRESPVNRLSVGVQSFSEHYLRAIGRNAGPEETLAGLNLLKAQWNKSWSLDLITGLPQQSADDAQHDLKTGLSFSPGHVSLYTLTVETDTPLHKRLQAGAVSESSPDEIAEVLTALWAFLGQNGFGHYEISNFARPQQTGRHNWYYWRLQPYLGVGPSAVSTLQHSNGHAVRASVPASIPEFLLSTSPEELLECELLTPDQFMLEYLMMGLRTVPGIEVETFSSIFGYDLRDILQNTLRTHLQPGRLKLHTPQGKDFLSVTEGGMLLLDHILVQAASEIEGLHPQLHWPLRSLRPVIGNGM